MYICHFCEGVFCCWLFVCSFHLIVICQPVFISAAWADPACVTNRNAFNATNICINVGFTTWTSLSARWVFSPWVVSHRSRNEQHSWYMELCLTKQQLLLRNEIPKAIPQALKFRVCSQQCTGMQLRAPGAEAASSQPQTAATQEGIPEVYIYIYIYINIYRGLYGSLTATSTHSLPFHQLKILTV